MISTRGRALACSWTCVWIFWICARGKLMVRRTTWESGPCSACERRSEATYLGLEVESAMTRTSEGPAGMSMETSAEESFCNNCNC